MINENKTFFDGVTSVAFSSLLSSDCVVGDDDDTATTVFFDLAFFFLLTNVVSFCCFFVVDFLSLFAGCFDEKKSRPATVTINNKAKIAPETIASIDDDKLLVNCSNNDPVDILTK